MLTRAEVIEKLMFEQLMIERAERTGWNVLLPCIERVVVWPALYTDEGGEA
jgi:hypothetical protein